MDHAIQLLKHEALTRRGMTTPNANTITEFTAKENAELAEEFHLAARDLETLRPRVKELEALVIYWQSKYERERDLYDKQSLLIDSLNKVVEENINSWK